MGTKTTELFYSSIGYPGPNTTMSKQWSERIREYIKKSDNFYFLDAGLVHVDTLLVFLMITKTPME